MTSWHKKLRVQRIEANRPLLVISAFENGGVRRLETDDVLDFPFEVPYTYLGEKDGRSVLMVDADVPPGRD